MGRRPGFCGVAALVFLLGAVAADAQAASSPPCPESQGQLRCPALEWVDLSEALDGGLHVAWRDPHAGYALGYAVDTRDTAGGAWQLLVAAAGSASSVTVPSVGSGARELRLRARYPAGASGSAEIWSAASAPRAIVLRAACEGLPLLPANLSRIVANDRDGDGRLTGRDLAAALEACAQAGGCVVELLPWVYDDVAIVLSGGEGAACVSERTSCLALDFPKGLVIQGHGAASVLRSPLWKTPYRPVPVLEVWNRPDIRLTLRNFVLEGRKGEQVAPRPNKNDSMRWWHYGFQVWNQWGDHSVRSSDGCIHNVAVRNFLSRGITLMDVDRWVVEDSIIEDIGCLEGFTDCSALELPDAYEARGYKSAGIGLLVGWHADDVVLRRNQVRRATKYSIGLKHGTDGAETTIRRPVIEDNELRDAGSVGIFVAGIEKGRFARNTVDRTQLYGRRQEHVAYYDTFALTCGGRVEQTAFDSNRFLGSAGIAVNWQCAGRGNVFADGVISGSCREKGPRSCAPGKPNACYSPADFNVRPTAGGSLRLVRTQVTDSGCSSPLSSTGPMDLVIDGGRYAAGGAANRPVTVRNGAITVQGGAQFDDVVIEFERGARAVVTESVQSTGLGWFEPAFRSREGASVLICGDDPEACADRCAAPVPPEWCGR